MAERPLADEELTGELVEDHGGWVGKVGEVLRRGKVGLAGTGRGFKNLSVGSMVRCSEVVEPTLSFRERVVLGRANGMFKTLTSWPGSMGQAVVAGSAELWNSNSSSSLYWRRKMSIGAKKDSVRHT